MTLKKTLMTFMILLFVTSIFSAIGYEHFTVRENQVFTDLLVQISREFKTFETYLEQQGETAEPGENILTRMNTAAFGMMIESIIAGYNIDIVVTDKSGTILYDADPQEIGKNTLTDPMYQNFTELVELFEQRITVEGKGEGSYTFLATGLEEIQEKRVMWNTIKAFGQEIKVCMITK